MTSPQSVLAVAWTASTDAVGVPGAEAPGPKSTYPAGNLIALSIQSGRGTWPVDSAATCREARCERHGDGRFNMDTSRSRAALDAWPVEAEETLRDHEKPDTSQEWGDDPVEHGDAA
jgi:hypothetical protein